MAAAISEKCSNERASQITERGKQDLLHQTTTQRVEELRLDQWLAAMKQTAHLKREQTTKSDTGPEYSREERQDAAGFLSKWWTKEDRTLAVARWVLTGGR